MKQKILFILFCSVLLISVLASVRYTNEKTKNLLSFNFGTEDGDFSTLNFSDETIATAQPAAFTEDISPAIALQNAYNNIADSAIPAVVSIQVEGANTSGQQQQFFGNEEFLRRFFGFEETPQSPTRSYGSGFVISKDGYLISNYHVVKGASKITIFFSKDKSTYTAKVVGTDPDTDIALLKINEKGNFPYLSMGNSQSARIGDIVIAIGNPFNLSHTFTTGVISAIGRSGIAKSKYENYLQTDVAINPGNSGGPLINLTGEVIGINSVIISRGGGNIGIGFSIPINSAKRIVKELKETGTVTRGWIGIHYNEISEEVAKALKIENRGILISKVVPKSPASKAGLKAGDVMTSFNRTSIYKSSDLLNQIATIRVGRKVPVEYYRNGRKRNGYITLQKQSNQITDNLLSSPESNKYNNKDQTGTFGIVVENMSAEFLQKNNTSTPYGVIVTKISTQSSLYKNGVRSGDVIEAINYKPVTTTTKFNSILKKVTEGENILFRINRLGFVSYIVTTL